MIELPKDAEGREIPLDTETLYTDRGPIFRVEKFEYMRSMGWRIYGHYEAETIHFAVIPSCLHLTQPDSWKRLLDDLDRCSNVSDYEECAYFGTDASNCLSCVAGQESSCSKTAMRDIASRIRKLSGEGE